MIYAYYIMKYRQADYLYNPFTVIAHLLRSDIRISNDSTCSTSLNRDLWSSLICTKKDIYYAAIHIK